MFNFLTGKMPKYLYMIINNKVERLTRSLKVDQDTWSYLTDSNRYFQISRNEIGSTCFTTRKETEELLNY